jgi:1-deoxy-D-xylulose-5-phosphate synthase
MEEDVEWGGFGQTVAGFVSEHCLPLRCVNVSIKDLFVEHGTVYELHQRTGLDPQSIRKKVFS